MCLCQPISALEAGIRLCNRFKCFLPKPLLPSVNRRHFNDLVSGKTAQKPCVGISGQKANLSIPKQRMLLRTLYRRLSLKDQYIFCLCEKIGGTGCQGHRCHQFLFAIDLLCR